MKKIEHNYLPEQYEVTNELPINHNYLPQQFEDSEKVLDEIRKLVLKGDFTLGTAVNEFEDEFKKLTKKEYAIGVGSGTDAIFLSLKALGIKEGDEVITTPYTFYATIGAIVTAGAIPKFVDIGLDYNIDPKRIEDVITSKTKAIVPVHWSGLICDMNAIRAIANKHNLSIVEDACHAINAEREEEAARKAYAMGMKVYFNDIAKISLKKQEKEYVFLGLEELLSISNFISIHCDLNDSSFHLIGKEEFKLMDKDSIIINTSRGSIINEKELIIALEKNFIGGAALDVFEKEPLPRNSKLRNFKNVFLSPHNSNASPETFKEVDKKAIKNVFIGLGLNEKNLNLN